MNMDKIHVRKILLSVLIFVTGMFSVSIANVFGGYFGAVAAIQVVAATVYLTYSLGDKQLNKTNLTDFVLVGLVLLFGVLFFVVNDVVGVSVYVKNKIDFWGVCVLTSQVISMLSLVYTVGVFVFRLNKNHIEVIDNSEETIKNFNENVNEEVSETAEETETKREPEEIKSISRNNVKVDVPFMEEEN